MSGTSKPIAVVGGGLTGLVAALRLLKGGRQVVLFERSSRVGGRAGSTRERGFTMNFGPRALYLGGRARRILAGLGVPLRGRVADGRGGCLIDQGRTRRLPSGLMEALRSDVFTWGQKARLVATLARVVSRAGRSPAGPSIGEWLAAVCRDARVQSFLLMLVRLGTYVDAPEALSADAGLEQLALAMRGAMYLDGGWQTLVDDVLARAMPLGLQVRSGVAVERVEYGGAAEAVTSNDGSTVEVGGVLLCCSPAQVSSLLGSDPIASSWARNSVPVKVACLDVALRDLPSTEAPVALAIDAPLYYAVHSRYAKLAPGTGAVIHLARYFRPDEAREGHERRRELEALLDSMQPRWRDHVVQQRFLPEMIAANDFPRARSGGLPGRAPFRHPSIGNLFVAGDWVGRRGLLLDAALSSAERAANAMLGSRG